MTDREKLIEAQRLADQAAEIERLTAALDAERAARQKAENPEADPDYDPAADTRWLSGCNFAIDQLAHCLGVPLDAFSWDAATETLDGDVQSVIGNALTAGLGDEWQNIKAALAAERERAERLAAEVEKWKAQNARLLPLRCACRFDEDGETILEWCAAHAMHRDALTAEIERLTAALAAEKAARRK